MLKLILVTLYFVACLADAKPEPENAAAAKNLAAESPFSYRDDNYAVGAFAKVNWFQAQLTCASQGMTLISFQKESDLVDARNWILTNAIFISTERLWTSGTNLANQGVWSWFSNGRPFSYKNWFPNQPDNLTGDEHCLEFDAASGQWNDIACATANYFICEARCSYKSV